MILRFTILPARETEANFSGEEGNSLSMVSANAFISKLAPGKGSMPISLSLCSCSCLTCSWSVRGLFPGLISIGAKIVKRRGLVQPITYLCYSYDRFSIHTSRPVSPTGTMVFRSPPIWHQHNSLSGNSGRKKLGYGFFNSRTSV